MLLTFAVRDFGLERDMSGSGCECRLSKYRRFSVLVRIHLFHGGYGGSSVRRSILILSSH